MFVTNEREWSKSELAYLKRFYKTTPNSEIAYALDREVKEVVYVARKLNLYKGLRRLKQMGRENAERQRG